MALGVTFPKNEDVVAFERKNEMLVLLVSKSGTYKKELGNYAGYWLRKMYWKDLHCRGMQISRNALTHVMVKLLTPVFSIFRVLYFCIWYFERGLRAWNAVSSSPRNLTCQRLKQQDCPTDISCHIFLFWMFKYFMLWMSNFWILQCTGKQEKAVRKHTWLVKPPLPFITI